MSDLLALQRRLHRALSDPSDTLADVASDAVRRITIHKATIEAGLTQTLANVFPALRRVVGAPTFAMLATEFIAAAPPRHPLLSTFGRGFPPFISMQPIGVSLPYLQDLARVEWMRQEAYLAADAAILDASRLGTADPETLSALALKVHPATRIISSPFPIHTIWRVNQPDVKDEDIPALDMKAAEHVIITRPGDEIVTRGISLADATLVRAVTGGASLGAAVEAAFAMSPDFDVMHALAGHFAGGTFASL